MPVANNPGPSGLAALASPALLSHDPDEQDDSDFDGITDYWDCQVTGCETDSDFDGIAPDFLDSDDDGDTVPTLEEGTDDPDGDGLGNNVDSDSDSDGDGKLDGDELGDGVIDRLDADDTSPCTKPAGPLPGGDRGGLAPATPDYGCGCTV